MITAFLLALTALGGEDDVSYEEDEGVRFGQVQAAPADAEPKPEWRGGMRDHLYGIVGIETQLEQLGATPEDTVIISARLDWGTLVTTPDDAGGEGLRFARSGVSIRTQRLSDGELIRQGTVVDSTGTYDISDPNERAKLCTRVREGTVGTLTLHTWTDRDPVEAEDRRSAATSFLMVDDGNGDRTALVDLEPGESATVVELVVPEGTKRRMKVRRSLEITRGDKVITMTEGDALQRICLEF